MFSRDDFIIFLVILFLPLFLALFTHNQIPFSVEIKDKKEPYVKKISEIPAKVIWLDARTIDKFQTQHIPSAIHFELTNWEFSLEKLFAVYEPNFDIVVYCDASCTSSKEVAKRLRQELKVENIFYLEGGFTAWQNKK